MTLPSSGSQDLNSPGTEEKDHSGHKKITLLYKVKSKSSKHISDKCKTQMTQEFKDSNLKQAVNIFSTPYLQKPDKTEKMPFKTQFVNRSRKLSYIQRIKQNMLTYQKKIIEGKQQRQQQSFNITTNEVYKQDELRKVQQFNEKTRQQNLGRNSQRTKLLSSGHTAVPRIQSKNQVYQSRIHYSQLRERQEKRKNSNQRKNKAVSTSKAGTNCKEGSFSETKTKASSRETEQRNVSLLPNESNLYRSIKQYENKNSVLSEIFHKRNPLEKYGCSYFEHLLRDRYKEDEKMHEFVIKVRYDKQGNPEQHSKTDFIVELQKGKFGYRYKRRQFPKKLHGVKLQRMRTEGVIC